MAHFNPLPYLLCGALFGALFAGQAAQARSTLAVRFDERAIAGPGVEQTVPLYLHYFIGDGEAVLSARITCDPEKVLIRGARSSLGQARTGESAVEIDYRTRPLGREQVDTLQLSLVALTGTGPLVWRSTLATTADSNAASGGSAQLHVAAPLQTALNLHPEVVFAGEQLRLDAVVNNTDTRPLEEVVWQWPPGLLVEVQHTRPRWSPPLAPGARDTLVWQARIEGRTTGPLAIRGRADGAGVIGSPVSGSALQVVAAPVAQLTPAGGQWLEKGRPGRLVGSLQNSGASPMAIDAWRLEIPATFAEVRLIQSSQGRALLLEREVLVEGIGVLAAGQTALLELEVTPERSGPFNWGFAFRPAQRAEFIPLSGQAVLRVADAKNTLAPAPTDQVTTDLELLRRAFAQAAESALLQLPLPPGAQVCLEPFEKSDKNWVLDDALVSVLMRQGYEVVLKPEAAAAVLHYRLADSRVVYTPGPKGWNPFGTRQRREVYGELYLRLEGPDQHLRWIQRVQAYQADVVPGKSGTEAASALFKSTRVEDRHKGIERGLSASIIGGLFYIFFIP